MNALVDTNIFLDYLFDQANADQAENFFSDAISCRHTIYLCEPVLFELKIKGLSKEAESDIFGILKNKNKIRFIEESIEDSKKAEELAKQLNIPMNDALIALLAKRNGLIVITRDKHFLENLNTITDAFRPEEI